MSAQRATTKPTDDKIIALYMDYVLTHETFPKSVYKFCKDNKLKEDAFYANFGSLDALKTAIWDKFYQHTLGLITKNEDYAGFSNKDKMLTFFYSFFELLTLNRSYVLFALGTDRELMGKLKELKGLRRDIKTFATDIIEEANAEKVFKLTQHKPQLFAEGAWVQFLFLLKFWMDDGSAGFEKTDLAIEKSVTTIFDVFDNTPLDSLLDFGKFLYKEKMA